LLGECGIQDAVDPEFTLRESRSIRHTVKGHGEAGAGNRKYAKGEDDL
jgi:hypothetical protein